MVINSSVNFCNKSLKKLLFFYFSVTGIPLHVLATLNDLFDVMIVADVTQVFKANMNDFVVVIAIQLNKACKAVLDFMPLILQSGPAPQNYRSCAPSQTVLSIL